MRTILQNLAKALEGRFEVTAIEQPDGTAVVIRTLNGEWVTERKFTHRQTANKELLEIILSDVRHQLMQAEAGLGSRLGAPATPLQPVDGRALFPESTTQLAMTPGPALDSR
ncbi:hypothetical protein [Pseudomonas sp. Marseille-QA0892]